MHITSASDVHFISLTKGRNVKVTTWNDNKIWINGYKEGASSWFKIWFNFNVHPYFVITSIGTLIIENL